MMLQASGQALLGEVPSNARYATLLTQLTNGSKTEKSTLVPNAADPVNNPNSTEVEA